MRPHQRTESFGAPDDARTGSAQKRLDRWSPIEAFAGMIRVTDDIAIAENEIDESFVRASGPGGQNVNKVATAVQLRFDARRSPSLPEPVRERLERLAGGRLTKEGVIVIFADRYRTQERNRQDALQRLIALISRASQTPRPRKATRPTAASRERRLQDKAGRGELKRTRRSPPLDD